MFGRNVKWTRVVCLPPLSRKPTPIRSASVWAGSAAGAGTAKGSWKQTCCVAWLSMWGWPGNRNSHHHMINCLKYSTHSYWILLISDTLAPSLTCHMCQICLIETHSIVDTSQDSQKPTAPNPFKQHKQILRRQGAWLQSSGRHQGGCGWSTKVMTCRFGLLSTR